MDNNLRKLYRWMLIYRGEVTDQFNVYDNCYKIIVNGYKWTTARHLYLRLKNIRGNEEYMRGWR